MEWVRHVFSSETFKGWRTDVFRVQTGKTKNLVIQFVTFFWDGEGECGPKSKVVGNLQLGDKKITAWIN